MCITPENFWNEVWHRDCPKSKFGAGIMKKLWNVPRKDLDGDYFLTAYECLHCGQRCYAGLNADRQIVVEPLAKGWVYQRPQPSEPQKIDKPSLADRAIEGLREFESKLTFEHLHRFAEELRDKAITEAEYEAASVARQIMGEIQRLAREVGIEI